jgi:CRP-like cAMP-binding protein
MSVEDDIALLERVPTFAPLGREALRIIAIGAESRSIQEGDVLFRTGETADCAYVIESGSLKLESSHEGVEPVVVRRAALLGELALLTETRRPATATAQELSLVMRIMRPLFLKMLDAYPDVAVRLRETLLKRTEQLANELFSVRHAFPPDDDAPAFVPDEPAAAPVAEPDATSVEPEAISVEADESEAVPAPKSEPTVSE